MFITRERVVLMGQVTVVYESWGELFVDDELDSVERSLWFVGRAMPVSGTIGFDLLDIFWTLFERPPSLLGRSKMTDCVDVNGNI